MDAGLGVEWPNGDQSTIDRRAHIPAVQEVDDAIGILAETSDVQIRVTSMTLAEE
jgi:hypothetical protein